MDLNPSTELSKLRNMSQAELVALVNAHTKERGPPGPSLDGAKNTIFGWTEDGKGVWVLPGSKVNLERFENVAKSRPDLEQCELMRLAGAEYFADWRDSDRARAANKDGLDDMKQNDGASSHPDAH